MITLDLSKIKPLDVILTTTGDWESGAIRAAQMISRLRGAAYSHAAIFIAPTLVYESGENDVNFSNLVKPPHMLHWGRRDGKITLCVSNPKWTNAVVLRNKKLAGERFPFSRYRREIIAAIAKAHWAQYPHYSSFSRASEWIPDWLTGVLSACEQTLTEKKWNPGFFCSELVSAIHSEINGTARDGHAPVPIDFLHDDEFARHPEAIMPDSTKETFPFAVDRVRNLMEPSFLGRSDVKFSKPNMLALGKMLHTVFDNPKFEEMRASLVFEELAYLSRWCDDISQPFWYWFGHVQACFSTCPEKQRSKNSKLSSLNVLQACSSPIQCNTTDQPAHRFHLFEDKYSQLEQAWADAISAEVAKMCEESEKKF